MPDFETDVSNERRIYQRYRLPLNFTTNNRRAEPMKDHLCNISKGGACFLSNAPYHQDDFVLLNFSAQKEVPVDETQFSIVGKIVWVNNNNDKDLFKYGARFEFYDDPFSKQQYSQMVSTINKFISFSSAYRSN